MDDRVKDQKQYFELKTVLTEQLTKLGFTVKSESTKGLGGGIDFEKDGFLVELVYDLRDRMLFLETSKDSTSFRRIILRAPPPMCQSGH